jgi:hypothetical protein
MNGRELKRAFAARPGDPDTWVRKPGAEGMGEGKGEVFTARLTIDITPELRGRIKVAAFRRRITVADMLRDLLAREFAGEDGGVA